MLLIYRKLDNNNDMVFGGNANDFYHDTDAVGQAIFTSLKLLQGEFWLDKSIGLPLFQHIVGQSGTPEHLHAADMLVQEVILGVQGVNQIISFSSTYQNRQYAIEQITAQTQFGQVVVSGVTFSG